MRRRYVGDAERRYFDDVVTTTPTGLKLALADVELGIRASGHAQLERWTGMVPFARLRLVAGEKETPF